MPTTKSQISISLTSFASFCVADAQKKNTQIRQIRDRYEQDYSPGADHWMAWRRGLLRALERGDDLNALYDALPDHDSKKDASYRQASEGIARWLKQMGRVKFVGKAPKRAWVFEDVSVGLNPEFVVEIDGRTIFVKLYLRTSERDRLNKRRADPLLQLLHDHYDDVADDIMLVDVCAGKWFKASARRYPDRLRNSVVGQAAALQAMWRQMGG